MCLFSTCAIAVSYSHLDVYKRQQVVDAFYVKDMFGLKLHAKTKQESLDKKLRQAIAEGAERAQQ